VLKVFSSLLNTAEEEGKLQGVSICDNAPSVTDLLFPDDSLLLLKVNEESGNHLQYVLQLYEECSGQTINKETSSLMFRTNTRIQARDEFLSCLQISQEAWTNKYLGLPVYMGTSKAQMFFLSQREGMEADPRVERKATI
jgi:hypothetical protein